jgi:Domain of unknown function (DUF4032)
VDLDPILGEIRSVADRYGALWHALHARPTFSFVRRQDAAVEVRRLNELGYAVDEVRLTGPADGRDEVRLHTVVSHRRHHAVELQRLTGLQVGEGQATVLLDDLHSHGRSLPGIPAAHVARSWLEHVLHPAAERLLAALGGARDVVQDYCDLLEVRWLLSERAGRDVGDEAAIRVLAAGLVPAGAAAELGSARTWASGQQAPAPEQRRTA